MLTQKQYELLTFIDERLRGSGVAPSFDEMREALGLKSKSGIHRLITGLEQRGFIRRIAHHARALEVLKLPHNAPENQAANNAFDAKVIHGDFKGSGENVSEIAGEEGGEVVDLPLYGRIAAGTPIEALRDESAMLSLPSSMLGRGDHYALEVDGDSMIEAGIFDGDTVIIERCETADNGTIVVALIDDNEVTLKRLRRRGNSVALEPANQAFETRIFGPDRVKIQGRLIGLLRRY